MNVLMFFRKPRPGFQSIERVFEEVSKYFKDSISISRIEVPFENNSFINICKNIIFSGKQKADIYHITGDIHYISLLLPAKRTILTIHDCGFLNRPPGIRRAIIKWLYLDLPVKRVRYVTAISDATRNMILANTKCNPQKIIVIPNPVNSSIEYVEKVFNPERPKILFIGTRINKNLERAIEAIANLKCVLVVVGLVSTNQKNLLEAHNIDFENHVNIPAPDLARLYKLCDIVLFPSLFEGFGLPIIEGQKAGRVVLTSNIEPMRSVSGGGAILVDPYDTLSIRKGVVQAINLGREREELIRKGFENVRKYEASKIADDFMILYKQIHS